MNERKRFLEMANLEIDYGEGAKRRRDLDDFDYDDAYDLLEMDDMDDIDDIDDMESEFDCEEPELDVETYEIRLSGIENKPVTIRLCRAPNEERTPGLYNLHATCTSDGIEVGHVLARLIFRESIRANFWTRMEELSEDASRIAFDIFDRYGKLKPKFTQHPIQRGTGVWGEELNDGLLVTIETFHITEPEFRGKGFGKKLLSLLLQKAKRFFQDEKPSSHEILYAPTEESERNWALHAIAYPGSLQAHVEPQYQGKSQSEQCDINRKAFDDATAFWRAGGFRRIGASSCFGFSFDERHQSRLLAREEDYDPPTLDEEDCVDEKQRMQLMLAKYPLHHAAVTLGDGESVENFKAKTTNAFSSADVDGKGQTLLHVTARMAKLQSTIWLLENVPDAQGWKLVRDNDGYTPLEALQDELETRRTIRNAQLMTLVVSDDFEGYQPNEVKCLFVLQQSPGPQELSFLDVARARYGCTCGQCLGGFLSPRMSFVLAWRGRHLYHALKDEADDGELWVIINTQAIAYLTRGVQKNMRNHQSLRYGYATIFRLVPKCLESKKLPTNETIEELLRDHSKLSSRMKTFFERVGTEQALRAALRHLIEYAKFGDKLAGKKNNLKPPPEEELDMLPACRNDCEYEFIINAWRLRSEQPSSEQDIWNDFAVPTVRAV